MFNFVIKRFFGRDGGLEVELGLQEAAGLGSGGVRPPKLTFFKLVYKYLFIKKQY